MLAKLRGEMVTMVIATSKPTVFAEKIAKHFNFDLIAGSELDGTRSRKSEVITYALTIVDPDRMELAVMIGDREHDIIGGHDTKIKSIGVTWGYGSRPELENAKATWIVDSLDGLSNIILSK